MLEYKLAWANANAAQEIINFIEKAVAQCEALEKKQRGDVIDQLRVAIS